MLTSPMANMISAILKYRETRPIAPTTHSAVKIKAATIMRKYTIMKRMMEKTADVVFFLNSGEVRTDIFCMEKIKDEFARRNQ